MDDPNDRAHRNFILDGEYPPGFEMEQHEREHRMAMEGGELRGNHLPGTPNSPEMYERQMEDQEYRRACHGGVPDAPEALPQPPTPFAGMKG